MNPTLKKALTAVAAKQVFDKVNERRKPKKPSFLARFGRFLLIAGGLGAGYYAYKNGQLDSLIGKVKGETPSGGSSSNGAGSTDEITFRSETAPVGTPVG